MKSKVATIIVTYNRVRLLLKVMEAVKRELVSTGIIIIIDNNSDDETDKILCEKGIIDKKFIEYDLVGKLSIKEGNKLKIIYLKLNENIGGSGGFYYGVEIALKEKWDWLWFLDDDAEPQTKCLEKLLEYKDKHSVLIPLRISEKIDYREFPAIKFNMENPFLRKVRDVEFYKQFASVNDFPETVEVEDFSFEGPLIKREIIEEIGLPKKDIFISGDDTDYALRILTKYKKKHLLITKAIINRLDSLKPSTDIPLWKEYYLKRNYYYTHYRFGKNVFVKIKPLFLFVFSIFKNIIKGKMNIERLKVNYFAFVDSLKKRMPIRYRPNSKI
jgi:GT2 family glycosyltransferase